MSALIDFFEGYIKSSKAQIILITHRAEMFGKIADNILHVKKEDGLANVRSISYQEYLEELK
jgi:chromosome segregation ATPase